VLKKQPSLIGYLVEMICFIVSKNCNYKTLKHKTLCTIRSIFFSLSLEQCGLGTISQSAVI